MGFSIEEEEELAALRLKLLKEEFVSGLNGGGIYEVNLVTIVSVSAYALWAILQTRYALFTEKSPILMVVEFIIDWVFVLLAITVYSFSPTVLNLLILGPCVLLSLNRIKLKKSIRQRIAEHRNASVSSAISINEKRATKKNRSTLSKESINDHGLNNNKNNDNDSNDIKNRNTNNTNNNISINNNDNNDKNNFNNNNEKNNSSDVWQKNESHLLKSKASQELLINKMIPKKSFLTVYRADMIIITCLAILAVDFPIFPRRFAKVETWGTSLMDLGVGSFVFSMGIVSARTSLKVTLLNKYLSFKPLMLGSLKSAAPTLSLGIIRLVLVKSFKYQEHVTEYGVHWNFFMTLGLLPPFVALAGYVTRFKLSMPSALAVGIVYQALLYFTKLQTFILMSERTNIISENKEGIFSFFGYLSIFLLGQSIGIKILPVKPLHCESISSAESSDDDDVERKNNEPNKNLWIIKYLLSASLIFTILFQISTRLLDIQVSRRLANLSYILWTAAYNTSFLSLFIIVDSYFIAPSAEYTDRVPRGLEAVNYNGLAIFLLANLVTGIINILFDTLHASTFTALRLLIVYSVILASFAEFLYRRKIQIRIS